MQDILFLIMKISIGIEKSSSSFFFCGRRCVVVSPRSLAVVSMTDDWWLVAVMTDDWRLWRSRGLADTTTSGVWIWKSDVKCLSLIYVCMDGSSFLPYLSTILTLLHLKVPKILI